MIEGTKRVGIMNFDGKCISERIPNENEFDLKELYSNKLPGRLECLYGNRINNQTEYVSLPTFNNPVIDKDFEQFLNVSKSKNLIIDVRGNASRSLEKAINVTALLLKDKKTIGYIDSSYKIINLIAINPSEKYIDKFEKIIILANRNTGGCAENIFIKALKNNSYKIEILGTNTMGTSHKAAGIEPDVFVDNGSDILRGRDNQLSMALKIING
jgi:C-terminal processing protease CtpA/Prc